MKRPQVVNRAAARRESTRRIYGVHPVVEWLRACPAHVQAVYCDRRAVERVGELPRLARAGEVPLHMTEVEALTALVGHGRHQGVVATTAEFPYVDLEQVVAATPRLLLVADQVQDPQNLGALIRTAAAVDAGAVVIPRDGATAVTPAVEMAAAGGAALVGICRVTNTARALEQLKRAGVWSAALMPCGGTDLFRFDPPERLALVVGSEAGMRPLVARHCDLAVSIRMWGAVESLNVSVAAAVALYEVRRRWDV